MTNGRSGLDRSVLREILIWSIPALLLGLALRLILLSYSPYAYWGSDSRSYYGFTTGVMTEFYFSINEKRRYLYPLLLLPTAWFPGGSLRVMAWLQAGIGLLTILPFAYLIRENFRAWKFLIIPLTALLAGLPVFIWYEHELIAEALFFSSLIWAMAGWTVWMRSSEGKAPNAWWWFLIPFGTAVLLKPAIKFFWPGLAVAMVIVFAWKRMNWMGWVGLTAVFLVSLTVGDGSQSSRLLYTTAFPLTNVDSDSYAPYKAEIRDWVLKKRERLGVYDEEDDRIHDFLREPEAQDKFPQWRDLAQDSEERLNAMYMSLALEGIWSNPVGFLQIGMQRLVGSANLEDFKVDRFEATYFADRLGEAQADDRNPDDMIKLAFGLPLGEPLPDDATLLGWVAPRPDAAGAKFLKGYAESYHWAGRLFVRPDMRADSSGGLGVTVLGIYLIVAMALSFFPSYLRTFGVWNLIFLGYLGSVFLVGIEHTRYFAPVWPLVILNLGIPLDLLARRVLKAPAEVDSGS